MPLRNYGVLKGRPIRRQPGSGQNPHYQIHVVDDHDDYRIAVNVLSQVAPSEVEYLIDSDFHHPFLARLEALPAGWHVLKRKPGGPALDYIRGNLFDPRRMVPLPFNVPGPDNDLNEKIDLYMRRAMADEHASLYAFGERWGPEPNVKDKIFGFRPGNGVHDIHMNQANSAGFASSDGVYQDGALLLHFPARRQWVGIFLKFQSQGWHSDDRTGHRIAGSGGPSSDAFAPGDPFAPGAVPTPQAPDGAVRIVGALASVPGSSEPASVTLMNVTAAGIDLTGWRLLDGDKNAMALDGVGVIGAGETLWIALRAPVVLSDQGGLVTLLDPRGLRVDGVGYTAAQAGPPGFTIKF